MLAVFLFPSGKKQNGLGAIDRSADWLLLLLLLLLLVGAHPNPGGGVTIRFNNCSSGGQYIHILVDDG